MRGHMHGEDSHAARPFAATPIRSLREYAGRPVFVTAVRLSDGPADEDQLQLACAYAQYVRPNHDYNGAV